MKLWFEEPCPHGRWVTSPACQLLIDDGSECPGASSKQPTTLDLVAALQEEGVGEEAFIEFNADLRAYTVDGAALDDGVYWVVRIEGEGS